MRKTGGKLVVRAACFCCYCAGIFAIELNDEQGSQESHIGEILEQNDWINSSRRVRPVVLVLL